MFFIHKNRNYKSFSTVTLRGSSVGEALSLLPKKSPVQIPSRPLEIFVVVNFRVPMKLIEVYKCWPETHSYKKKQEFLYLRERWEEIKEGITIISLT